MPLSTDLHKFRLILELRIRYHRESLDIGIRGIHEISEIKNAGEGGLSWVVEKIRPLSTPF